MSIITTDVVAEWGAYYRAGGQGQADLINMFYQQDETSKVLQLNPTEKTVLEKSSASISEVMQAYQKDFTTKGDSTFLPRVIPLSKLKIDVAEVPDDLEQSWLGFLASEKLSRKDWPFIKYWIQELIMKQEIADFENNVVYSGVKGAVTPGTATTAAASMDGIRKIINDHITATDITSIVTGAPNADAVTWLEQVEAFYEGIDDLYRPHVGSIQMSKTLQRRFNQGMREKYNMSYEQAALSKIIDSDCSIIGLASHASASKIWGTVKGNAVLGVKKPKNPGHFKVEEYQRLVSVHTDYYKGVGFWLPELVFTNDQDLI